MFKHVNNKKGFTLVELLATIVVLGIVAAIATPAVLGVIEKSKKNAMVANARQMISATKTYVSENPDTTATEVTLATLVADGFMEPIKDVDSSTAITNTSGSKVAFTKASNQITYTVTLLGTKRTITSIAESGLGAEDVITTP
jgi:type IV pilus assembly protein PilA